MKIPIVKEHGSWVVFILCSLAGIFVGLSVNLWQIGRYSPVEILITILGLALLINSKKPLTSALRTEAGKKTHILWFALFSLTGCVLLIPFLMKGLHTFLVFSPLFLSYIILLSSGKEHYLVTELIGFSLLSLSAPIIYFVITGEMSLRLYFAVFIFFAAGVLKVRVRLKRTFLYKWLMVLYCSVTLIFFSHVLNLSIVILLPLIENIMSVFWIRQEALKTTGNIELIKGGVFTSLLVFFW